MTEWIVIGWALWVALCVYSAQKWAWAATRELKRIRKALEKRN